MTMAEAQQHLFNNLVLLHELKPGNSDFFKCIKENMFAKPNRTAFDQVLFYLCSTYDPARYIPKVPWPILDRSQERSFRQNTVSFVKEIVKEVPEARIPPFSPSFLSTPGGDRLTKFMWKFSLLVLKTVVEKESDYAVLSYPTAGLHILQNITDANMEEFRQDTDALSKKIIDASTYAKKLANEIVEQSKECKAIQCQLSDILQRSEHCPLTNDEKAIILDGDEEQSDAVLQKWQNILDCQIDESVKKLNRIKDQSVVIKNCYESVKKLVNSKTMPLILDATDFPPSVKDADGNLDLAFLLSEGAKAATSLLNSISMCGGFPSLESVLPELKHIRDQLQISEVSLTETKAGFLELMSESLQNISSSALENDQPDTPLKGNLQIGYEMLQDAQISTPPLVFETQNAPLKLRISAASPIDQFSGPKRPTRGKLPQEVGTPKASQRKMLPGLHSSFMGKVPTSSALQRKGTNSLKGYQNIASESPIVQTPLFCPKQNATSTACKSGLPKMNNKKISSFRSPIASVQEEDLSSNATIVDKLSEEPEQALKEDSVLDMKLCVTASKPKPKLLLDGPASPPKKSHTEQSPICVKKDTTNSKNILKIQKIKETPCIKSPILVKTPLRSPAVSSQDLKLNQSGLKDVLPRATHDAFDSPQSSCGVFSPPSANNSFFSVDAEMEFPALSVPKFDLGFDDDISPSGRVSLCPPSVEKVNEEPAGSVNQPKEKRKSLQALIHRYRNLVASSKPYEVPKLSFPLSPESDLPEENVSDEIGVQLDLNLDDLNV